MAYIGEDIPKLGFGLMRLPEYELNGEVVIDIKQLNLMIDEFMGAGFSYFDTAYSYHDGKSEMAAKQCLVDRYPRESFQLATKLPAWLARSADEAKEMFNTSLERTGAGFFDYYLLHNLGGQRTAAFEEYGLWDFALEMKEKGLIKYFGFSIHDKADALEQVLIDHPETDFVQLQINYADWDNVIIESRKCYEVARRYSKPIIVMEPVRGGSLMSLPSKAVSVFQNVNPEASLASWAIRYVAGLPGLITVLSGMSNLQQVQDNVSFMKDFKPLNATEKKAVEEVQEILSAVPRVPCTDCRYCLEECPEQVKIPIAFIAYNIYLIYGDLNRARESYNWNTEGGRAGGKASSCIACGACELVCPQQISIIEELANAAEVLEG